MRLGTTAPIIKFLTTICSKKLSSDLPWERLFKTVLKDRHARPFASASNLRRRFMSLSFWCMLHRRAQQSGPRLGQTFTKMRLGNFAQAAGVGLLRAPWLAVGLAVVWLVMLVAQHTTTPCSSGSVASARRLEGALQRQQTFASQFDRFSREPHVVTCRYGLFLELDAELIVFDPPFAGSLVPH